MPHHVIATEPIT